MRPFGTKAAIALLASTLLFTPAWAQVPPPSLRIATYNAFLLSPAFRCSNVNAADCVIQSSELTKDWATKLVAALRADSAAIDVVALNEVWDEDARQILVQGLTPIYPVQVRKIDAPLISPQAQAVSGLPADLRAVLPVSFAGEDSGLMLFAKPDFSIIELPSNAHRWGDDLGEIVEPLVPMAFTRFQDCALPDCLAAKGAALLRLRHGTSGPIYDIVFTHMQADDFDGPVLVPDVRARQFGDIRRMIVETLGTPAFLPGSAETIIMLGDLNVPTLFADPALAAATNNGKEFTDLFATTGSFYTSSLFEVWSGTSDVTDTSETNSIDHVRLDYILGSLAPPQTNATATSRQACFQHITIPERFAALESDHKMVLADVNRGFAFCSPSMARNVAIGAAGDPPLKPINDVGPGGADITRIATPGAMQWFRVRAPDSGTYSIGVDNFGLQADVFLPNDMSTPQSRYNLIPGASKPPVGEFHLDQYILPPIFYVRVSGKARTIAGNYRLEVLRHDCSSKEKACYLRPGDEMKANLSGSGTVTITTPQHEAWFRYDITEGPTAGGPTPVTIVAKLADTPRVTALLVDHNDPAGGAAPPGTEAGGVMTFAGPVQKGSHGYVLIRQSAPASGRTEVSATLDMPLRILTVRNLTCHDETNPEFGSDEIYSQFKIDGVVHRRPASGDLEFDCDEPADVKPWEALPGLSTVTYGDKVSARIVEADPSDSFAPWIDISNAPTGPSWAELRWRFNSGDYRMEFKVERSLNLPRGP